MTARVVSGNISDSGVTPSVIQNRKVVGRLRPVPGFRTSDDSLVFPTETTKTDASGNWSLTLESNNDIKPAGTHWEIEFQLGLDSSTWDIAVGDTNAGFLASIISVLPTLETSTFLTQEAGDARYALAEDAGGLAVCVAQNSTNPVVASGAYQRMNADTTVTETVAGMHDPATNNHRLVVPSGYGLARMTVYSIHTASSDTGNRELRVSLNSDSEATGVVDFLIDNARSRCPTRIVTRWFVVSAGDFFCAHMSQTTGSNKTLDWTGAGGVGEAFIQLECRKL